MSVNKTQKQLQKRKSKMIRLSQLVVEGDNVAREPVKAGVKRYGLLVPITVAGPYENDTYKIIDGVSRYCAMLELVNKDTFVPCYVVDKNIDDIKLKELSLASNISNRIDNKQIMVDYAKLMLENNRHGKSQCKMSDTIASLTGMTARYARKFLMVCEKGSPEILEEVVADRIAFTKLYDIVKASPDDHDKQNRLLSMVDKREDGYKIQNNHSLQGRMDKNLLLISGFYDVLQKKYNIQKNEFSDILYDVLNMLPESLQVEIVGFDGIE